jgi:hypothetical protein
MSIRKIIFLDASLNGDNRRLFVCYMAATGSLLALLPPVMQIAERQLVIASTIPNRLCVALFPTMLSAKQQSGCAIAALQLYSDKAFLRKSCVGRNRYGLLALGIRKFAAWRSRRGRIVVSKPAPANEAI